MEGPMKIGDLFAPAGRVALVTGGTSGLGHAIAEAFLQNGVDVADKVHIILLSTDDSKPLPERIVRQANKVGLFNALSFGDIMLRGQLKEQKK